MANVLNMKQLVGTSYYFLRQYFGKDVLTTDYDEFIPQNLKEKQSLAREETGASLIEDVVEEIMGVQAVGSTVLENKKGEEIAQLTFTELPTLYSSMNTSSVGLEIVPGRIVEDKVTKVGENKIKQKETVATSSLEGPVEEQENEDVEEENEYAEEENEEDNEKNKEDVNKIQNLAPPLPLPPIQVITEELNTAVKEAADYKVIQAQEQKRELEELKKSVDNATVEQTLSVFKLKKAEDEFKNTRSIFSFGKGDETLEQIVKEKQAEKEKAEAYYNAISEKYLEALKIERENKRKELEEEEIKKKKQTITKLEAIPEGDESEEVKDDSARQNVSDLAATTMNAVLSSVGQNRTQIEDKTKTFLTQAKEKLEEKQRSMKAFDQSNLDSQKIDSLREKNETLKKEIDEIYEGIEKNTEEYVKVFMVETQLTSNKEIKNKEIDELSDKIGELYDSIKLESMNLELILKVTEDDLKKKADDEQKRIQEEEARKALSDQQKADQMKAVDTFITGSMDRITSSKDPMILSIDRLKDLQSGKVSAPKSLNKGFIGFLEKQISTIEESILELEGLNTSIQAKLKENNLTHTPEIKTKYPVIDEIDVLIQKGKTTLPLAKNYLATEQEKMVKIETIKPEIATFLQKLKKVKDEITQKGLVITDDKGTMEAATDTMKIIETQYKIVQIENDTLQRKIKGISDDTINTENEKITQIIEEIEMRFETAEQNFKKLQINPSKTRLVQVKPIELVAKDPNEDESSIRTPTRADKGQPRPKQDVSSILKTLDNFLIETNTSKEKITKTGIKIAGEETPLKDAETELENIKRKYESIKLKNEKYKDTAQALISDERINKKLKTIQNSIDDIEVRIQTAEQSVQERKRKTPLFKKRNTTDTKAKSDELVVEDLEGISGPVISGKPLQGPNTSTDEDYDETDRRLQRMFDKTRKEEEARRQADIERKKSEIESREEKKRLQNIGVSNSKKQAEALLLNTKGYKGVSYGGGKKTKKHSPTNNKKTKKRHT